MAEYLPIHYSITISINERKCTGRMIDSWQQIIVKSKKNAAEQFASRFRFGIETWTSFCVLTSLNLFASSAGLKKN